MPLEQTRPCVYPFTVYKAHVPDPHPQVPSVLTSLHTHTHSLPAPCTQHHNFYSSKVRLPLASSFSPLPTPSPELSLLEPWRLGPYRASPALDTNQGWGCFQSLSKSSAVPHKGTGDTVYSSNTSSALPMCWELGTRWQLRQASPHALELIFQQGRQPRKNTVISDGDNCCEK